MLLKAAVMFQLQQHQMVGKAAKADACGGDAPINRQQGHQEQAFQIKGEFLGHRQRSVRAEIAIVAVPEHHEPMIERAIEDVLAHIAPMGRGQGGLHI